MVQRFVGALIVASGTQCSNYDTKKGAMIMAPR
jgi:hypothetical protein